MQMDTNDTIIFFTSTARVGSGLGRSTVLVHSSNSFKTSLFFRGMPVSALFSGCFANYSPIFAYQFLFYFLHVHRTQSSCSLQSLYVYVWVFIIIFLFYCFRWEGSGNALPDASWRRPDMCGFVTSAVLCRRWLHLHSLAADGGGHSLCLEGSWNSREGEISSFGRRCM